MSRYTHYGAMFTLLLILLQPAPALCVSSEIVGHAVMSAIPVSAIAVAFLKHDREGEKQWLRNTIANQTLTSIARLGFNETSLGRRPTGNGYGFPSGHVAFAGSGAAFLNERYGWTYGVPAWLATAYVANNRVENHDHHWRDVIAAMALSYGVGKLFVTPENAGYVAPVIGPDWLGLRWERSF